ncbi:MAG TPA: CAP domain-containing protein, partial [Streptosporangiaceae bacterium]|nr:CAP domain-containing protein [Streptosporangiaceae bacterium]
MPTRSSARRRAASPSHHHAAPSHAAPSHAAPSHAAPSRTQPGPRTQPAPAPAREPWDPHYTPPRQSRPPWAPLPGGNTPALDLPLSCPDFPVTGEYSGSDLLAGDTGPGPDLPTAELDPGSALLTAQPLPRPPRRLGDPLPAEPDGAGDPPPRAPRRDDGRPPRPPCRARYLLAVLPALALLGGGGYYLVHNSAPAAPSASGPASARPAPSSCAAAAGAVGSAASAAVAGAVGSGVPAGSAANAATCAGQPFGYVTASPSAVPSAHPRSLPSRRRHPAAGGPSSTPAASSSASTTPSSSATTSASSPAGATSASSPAGTSSGSAAAQVLALINQARSSAGLAPLTISSGLDRSASAHNATMAGGCGLSHQCPGEPELGARETAAGVHWTADGENIGEGGPVADNTAAIAKMAAALTQDMLNEKPPDDGHRRNILSRSFTRIGIAV